ncbi:MAG: hypothetical protein BWX79_02862 [Alphaproteobacteria bacterium ADurb.Bin100]|nr:MAG: hypothetical protein BWX79_02862 [Alphaproteobacteria bacterium ADurb.Bin100]
MLQLGRCRRHEFAAENHQGIKLFTRVQSNDLGGITHHVPQYPLQQVEILVQQGQGWLTDRRILDPRPGLAQVGHVLGQFSVAGILAVGAQDEAAARLTGQRLQARTQRLPLRGRDLLRDADVVVLRQEHQQAPGDADLGGQPGALGADRVLDHLHQQDLTFEHLPFDRQGARIRPRRTGGFALAGTGAKGSHEIGHVQEGGALQPDIDEGRLHAGQHAHNLAEVDVAHQPALQRALDMQLLHRTMLDHGHAGFLRRPIDQNFLLSHTLPLKKYPAQMRRNRTARSAPGSSRISN